MGVACKKNGFLRNSKDHIEEEKESAHLKLAKQGARTKMMVPYNENLQENGTNWKLGLRGRKG